MQERQSGMMLDGEPAIGGRDEKRFTYATKLGHKPGLFASASNVFQNCVAENDVELPVLERQRLPRNYGDVTQSGILLHQMGSVFGSHAGNLIWVRVKPFEKV